MRRLIIAFVSALFITLIPGTAQATSGDTTIYPIVCATPIETVYLAYGISSITITNPNGCSGTGDIYVGFGTGSTWTYSKTISGTTTSGSWDPAGPNLSVGTLGSADSFTLTLTSTTASEIVFGNAQRELRIFFNKRFNSLSPNPVAIGQQVTLTGINLSSVNSVQFSGPMFFAVNTENRTATQLTFTVPVSYYDSYAGITINLIPGTYRLLSAPGKTLTLTAAPTVAPISAEELARRAAEAALAQREVDKKIGRDVISNKLKGTEKISLENFRQADIAGITPENIEAVQAEIAALSETLRSDISQVLTIARKYEVVGIIASERIASVYSDTLIEIGLIPENSKNKEALTAAIKKLPASERSSYAAIKEVVDAEMAEIQARKDRYIAVLALIAS